MTSFLQRARGAAGSFSYCAYEKEISLQTPRLCKKTIGKGDKKMKSKKAVRSALGMSVLSIALCAAMLIGTTFAWFTDTASTAVNKIQAGTLDVALEMKDGDNWVSAEGKTLDFVKSPNAPAGEELLWEPGCTYNLPQLRVVNNGNLALKYKVVVSGVNGNSKLLKVIEFSVTKQGTGDTPETIDLTNFEGVLLPAGKTAGAGEEAGETTPITISGYMKKEAGNEYQGESIDGIAITVYATQYTYEFDSEGNQYDQESAYKGTQEFTSGEHTLNKGGVALNPNDIAVKVSGKGTNVTITGGYYDGGSGGNNQCVHVREGATVTIKGGTFTVGSDASGEGNSVIESNGGNIIIEGGFFYTNYTYDNKYYVLNQKNDHPGTITVKGGTFVNYDPSKGDDNLGGNFVAEGYSVLKQVQPNGDIWYTVVKGKLAGTSEELKDAISSAESGDTVTLTKSGTYTLPSLEGKALTIAGTKDTVIDLKNTVNKATAVNFEGVTVDFGTENYKGFQHTGALSFKDCVINGLMTTYCDATYENCTLNSGNDQYAINFYGGKNFTLTNCHFYGVNKNVYIYQEACDSDKNVTFNQCDFHMSAKDDLKSAVMLNAAGDFKQYKYNLVMNDCTADGTNNAGGVEEAGKTSYHGLYGLKHMFVNTPMLVSGTVTVDGTVVYQQ